MTQILKLLLGGSPCTHWSIAQTRHRETEPSGIGWELFKNYLAAREKYRPHYFLYENNKSIADAIKRQISRELKVEPILINSALVSAQYRQRLYWTNIPGVQQPKDRGILLRDVLDDMVLDNKRVNALPEAAEINHSLLPPSNSGYGKNPQTVMNSLAKPIRVGDMPTGKGIISGTQSKRIYSIEGKARTLMAHAKGGNGDTSAPSTGLYAVPVFIGCSGRKLSLTSTTDKSRRNRGNARNIYKIRDRSVMIGGKEYPVRLPDGCYMIRKLTVSECKRLQTVPEQYMFPVSASQAYKMLGNGWTADIVAYILSCCAELKTEPVEVLSMYDGMSCGQIALAKSGAHISRYYATEIDPYAIQTTQANYPGTIQLGDAFQVRDKGWTLPQCA